MKRIASLLLLIVVLPPSRAGAQELDLHGYIDFRAVAAPDTRSFVDGGLGKTRFGGDDVGAEFGGAALQAALQFTPEWLALSAVQFQTSDQGTLDVLETYVRYRPVSTTPWRWSLKFGAFFPPISLENDGVGWTSRWTLTPSAINSWIGEELRTFGGEVRVEWRGAANTFEAASAVYGGNDPAGELMAARGWSMSDLTYGYGSSVREPDALSLSIEGSPPYRFDPFVEIDHRLGWYGELTWRSREHGRVTLLRYDNNADPTTSTHYGPDHEVFSWHTYFWSLGAETRIGDMVLIGQAIQGGTEFEPSPFYQSETQFRAAYLLAGWDYGAWRPALRLDLFSARQFPTPLGSRDNEHGNAVTVAVNWRPRPWLRITGEVLRIDSSRTQRALVGLNESSVDTQVQLSVRVLF